MARRRHGIWIVGAKGGVATTVTLGLVALKKGLTGNQGLVTQLPRFANLDFLGWKDFIVGGHEIRSTTLYDEAMKLHTESRAIDDQLIAKCKTDLDRIDKNIVPGTLVNVGGTIEKFADEPLRRRVETPREAIERIQADLR
ncbi:MAG: inositol-3-phosphate synthase, partial [Planctomycetota bacterium]